MSIIHVLQIATEMASPWLASMAGIFALMALAARLIERGPRCEALSQFRRLGLPNDYETLICGSNPSVTDTDGDGLDDGEELSLGTNPAITDTDDDGMPDGTEVLGLVATDGAIRWMNIATAPNRTIVFTNADDEVAQVVLPFEVRIPGIASSNLSICANGLLALAEHSPALADGHYSNKSASNIPLGAAPSATIAAFWDDLAVNPEMGSCVSFATIGVPGSRTAILEFLNIGFYDGTTNDFVSFQIQFPESETNVVRVVFAEAGGLGNGYSATLGAKTSRGGCIEYSYNEIDSVFPGLAISYHIGLGTNPLLADTDGDGALPSTAIAGFFPVKLVQANMPQGCGGFNTTDAGTSYFREALPTNGIAYITGQPVAPQLTAKIKGLPEWMGVTWSMLLVTERGDHRFDGIDDRELPPVTLDGDANYDITARLNNEVVGGRCRLGIRVPNNVYTIYPFYIRGKNPLDATAKAYIDANVDTEFQPYAWMIAKHESKSYSRVYNQYNPREEKTELPNYGPPHGWGIAQIDKGRNGDSTAEVYDWHVNVASMNAILREKRSTAIRFLGYYSSAYSNYPTWTPPPSTNINGQVVSPELWSILTLYNGTQDIPWQETPTSPSRFRGPLQFNPSSGQWMFHHNSINPNYVRDVVTDSEMQGVE